MAEWFIFGTVYLFAGFWFAMQLETHMVKDQPLSEYIYLVMIFLWPVVMVFVFWPENKKKFSVPKYEVHHVYGKSGWVAYKIVGGIRVRTGIGDTPEEAIRNAMDKR